MSEILAGLKKIGGSGGENLIETVLWTNPSPTSNFGDTNITLSDAITNYDYIKIVSKYSTSSSDLGDIMVKSDTFKNLSASPYHFYPVAGCNPNTNVSGGRCYIYISDTVINIGHCYIINDRGTYDSYAIPYKIIGVKKQSGSKASELSCSTWTTTGAGTTFSAEIGKYYMLFINTLPSYAGYNLCVGGGTIIMNHYDNYGGRCAIVEIILATSTTVTTFSQYTHFCELIIS